MTQKTIITPEGKLRFPSLITPSSFNLQQGGKPKYTTGLEFSLEAEGIDAFITSIRLAVVDLLPALAKTVKDNDDLINPSKLGKFKIPLYLGDETNQYEAGKLILKSAWSYIKVPCFDTKKLPISEGLTHGTPARISFVPFAYEFAGSKGIGCNLRLVVKTGEAPSTADSDLEAICPTVADDPLKGLFE
jgi:hypothetical protein